MKLSDYIAFFLEKNNINDIFVLTGGCVVHIIDSIASNKNLNYVPVQHEQAGAMAADCYSRITKNAGAVVATSGPGATNLLTGICCSFYDSIPVLAITGQVPTSQLKGSSKSRQIGFQETDVVSIYKSVTKYSKLITNPLSIRYELEKALYLAKSGRPGPVLLDICDDIQRADIDPSKLKSFKIPKKRKPNNINFIKNFKELLKKSSRPILIVGAGVRLTSLRFNIEDLINKLGIPFSLTWGASDMVSHSHRLYVGSFGVTSGRSGNFSVQNSDLIITLGTRLDTHEVGSNIKTFAREAKRIVVDIDDAEQIKYKKMKFKVDLLHTTEVGQLIIDMLNDDFSSIKLTIKDWINKTRTWKDRYVACDENSKNQKKYINPYYFMEILSSRSKNNQILITDCGSNLIWTMQGFKVKKNQRVISAWNHSPMGYSLPASIGAAFAKKNQKIFCIIGDGGMQINIQELATIFKHQLNITIFIVNNHCHGIIQGTQENWLKKRFHASDPIKGKLPDPDFSKIAMAYGIKTIDLKSHFELDNQMAQIMKNKGPLLVNVHMLKESQIYPKLLFGNPIEDSHPLLDREEFRQQMIVKPL